MKTADPDDPAGIRLRLSSWTIFELPCSSISQAKKLLVCLSSELQPINPPVDRPNRLDETSNVNENDASGSDPRTSRNNLDATCNAMFRIGKPGV
jgi:hypothetical protein